MPRNADSIICKEFWEKKKKKSAFVFFFAVIEIKTVQSMAKIWMD